MVMARKAGRTKPMSPKADNLRGFTDTFHE